LGGGVAYDCTLAGNSAGSSGGGAQGSLLYRCVVSNNLAVGAGGGVFGGGPLLYDCRLVNNRTTGASGHGGGAASTDSSPLILLSNCVVAFNNAGGAGGGVRMGQLFNCLVYSNNPTGIHQSNASNSVFIANLAFNSSDFYNCLFIGYGVVCYANQKLYNCTAVGCNGNGFAAASGSISLYNCISWSNSAADSGVSAFNSCGAGNLYTNTLLGNTTNNPMFVADGSGIGGAHLPGNYRLQPSSPCVNRGTNQAWMAGKVDLDGRPRVRYGTVDMGAYETLYRGAVFKFR